MIGLIVCVESWRVLILTIEGVRSVLVDAKLYALEPMAYHFMRSFAKDNDLTIIEACLLPNKH